MPAYARRQIVVEDQVGVYHCIARCVRRALLCGVDPYTGQDYSHRKEWILDRMRELAGLFAIEVCGYSVMSNHLHLVLRNRPDIAEQWSDDEIALRWCRVFPPRHDATGEPVEPNEHDLAMLTANSERLAELRERLANLSWFMFKQAAGRPSTLLDAAGAARGAGSRARRRLEPPLCRPLARRRPVKQTSPLRVPQGAWPPRDSTRCPDRLDLDRRTVQLLTSSDHEQKPPSSRFGRPQTASRLRDWMRKSTAPTGDFFGVWIPPVIQCQTGVVIRPGITWSDHVRVWGRRRSGHPNP